MAEEFTAELLPLPPTLPWAHPSQGLGGKKGKQKALKARET